MTPNDIVCYEFDGKGGARRSAPTASGAATPAKGSGAFTWLHVSRDHPDAAHLLPALGLDPVVIDALTADETRPRCTVHGEGVLLNLRGVNLNPDAQPEDMISVRFWIEAHRVVGAWGRPLHAVDDLIAAIERGEAPQSPGDFVAKLALRLADRAEPSVAALNEQVDVMEEAVLADETDLPRAELGGLRRSAIVLRRYFVPQRDALTTLEIEDLGWLRNRDRVRVREAAERVQRLGEDLDAIRDRAQIIHDQIMDRRAEGMNRRMLLLSIVAAIFLPLGLLTGLFGVNLGGIPGADSPFAFAILCGALVVIGVGLWLWFRAIGMLR